MDRLDVCTERVALVLGPDSVLSIARYVGKPAAAWTGDHAANFYRTCLGTNQTRARISRWAASNILSAPPRWFAPSPIAWVRDEAVPADRRALSGRPRGDRRRVGV